MNEKLAGTDSFDNHNIFVPASAQIHTLCAIYSDLTYMTKTFLFLIITPTFLMISCTSSKNQVDCEKFKTGRFELHSEFDNSVSLIDRNDSIQTETNTTSGLLAKYKIKWTGKCQYELIYFKQTSSAADTIIAFVQSRPLKTTILKTGKDYYIFRSAMDGTDKSLVDTLRLIK